MNVFERIKEKCIYEPKIGRSSLDAFLKILREVEKEYNDGWIPCEERLPKEYVEVLAYGREGYVYLATLYDTEIYGKVWKQWNGGDLRLDWIIAWQPLPTAYVKGE